MNPVVIHTADLRRATQRWLIVAGLVVGLAVSGLAADIRVDGRSIRVTSSRYTVEFLDGVVVTIVNLLTGEVYTGNDDPESVLGLLPTGLSCARAVPNYDRINDVQAMHRHVYGHEPQAAVSNFFCQHKPWPQSEVTVETLGPAHVIVTYRGLWDGQPLPAENIVQAFKNRSYTFPEDSFELDLAVDTDTEDLIVRPTARSKYPGVCGVACSFANVKDDVRLVRSMYTGCETIGPEFPDCTMGLRWPSQWAVQLMIGTTSQGCFAIWAQDERAIVKYLHLRHEARLWALTVESMTDAPFGDKWEVKGVEWRFNTFKGDWRGPADRYKTWMKKAFGLVPLQNRKPAWMNDVRTVSWGAGSPSTMTNLAHVLPASRIAIVNIPPGYGRLDNPSIQWRPNAPIENPTRIEFDPGYPQHLDLIHQLGFHEATYLVFTYTDATHPLAARFWRARVIDCFGDHTDRSMKEIHIHPGCREYEKVWLGWMTDLIREFGMDGFYFDCCPQDGTNLNGPIDGLTVTQGTRKLLGKFARRHPDQVITGEYFDELLAGLYHFANATYVRHYGMEASRARARNAHPLMQYLFGDYMMFSSWWPGEGETFHLGVDQCEASGYAPSLTAGDANPDAVREAAFRLFRMKLFCDRGLANYWPEKWHPSVKSYWKADDGGICAYIWDQDGSRFVELDREDAITGRTLFRRIRSASGESALAGGVGGWIGYAGGKVIGLKPNNYYFSLDEPRYNEAQITRLPPGAYLANTRIHPAAVIVEVKSAGPNPVTGEIAFEAGSSMQWLMTPSADIRLQPGENNRSRGAVTVTTPVLLAFVKAATELRPGTQLTALKPFATYFTKSTDEASARETPRNYFQMRTRKTGDTVVSRLALGDWAPEKMEYVLKMPETQPLALDVSVTVSPNAINRKDFYIEVNGRQALKLTGEPRQTVTGTVPLTVYKGRLILLSLWAERPLPDGYTGPHEWTVAAVSP